MAIETLAFREQCPPQEISRRLEQGTLDIPPQLRDYFRAGGRPTGPAQTAPRFFSGRRKDSAADPLAIDPQLVIDYLEETMQHMIGAA